MWGKETTEEGGWVENRTGGQRATAAISVARPAKIAKSGSRHVGWRVEKLTNSPPAQEH